MTINEKIDYLFSKINWKESNLDSKAIEIMNNLKKDISKVSVEDKDKVRLSLDVSSNDEDADHRYISDNLYEAVYNNSADELWLHFIEPTKNF